MPAVKFLTNEDIRLRAVEVADADFMWEVECDSTQWIQNLMMAPLSKENLLQYALNYDANPFNAGQIRFIIVSNENERIGIVDLFDISAQHRTAKIGIYILPALRKQGLAAMALNLLIKYSKEILNLRQLVANVVDGNEESLRLFLNEGFCEAGLLKDWLLSGSETMSLHILQKKI